MVGTNVTIRMSEDEIRKLDELAQRMGKTRSDVIRDLISKFDEALRQEVEQERKKWMAIGFVGALESAILDPEIIVKFVRRNVDVLGYPDFVIGMARVRNRIVVFSHHDRTGNQLLQLVKARVEEEIRREEMEIEREEDEDEDTGDTKPIPARMHIGKLVRPDTVRVAPVVPRHKVIINNRSTTPIPRPIVASVADKSVVSGGNGNTKAASNASVAKNQEAGSTGIPTINNLATTQVKAPNPQASANGSGKGVPSPVGQGANHGLSGDFTFALIANLYHKYRGELLRLVESMIGE